MNPRVLVLILAMLFSGCVCDAAKDQAKITAAAHDGYIRKVAEGIASLTTADTAGLTPKTRGLLNNMSKSISKSRRAWHKLNFALNDVPVPDDVDQVPYVKSPDVLGD
jgi:hypothetical protein